MKSEIKSKTEYAYREKRKAGAPLEHIRIVEHIRGDKWKAECGSSPILVSSTTPSRCSSFAPGSNAKLFSRKRRTASGFSGGTPDSAAPSSGNVNRPKDPYQALYGQGGHACITCQKPSRLSIRASVSAQKSTSPPYSWRAEAVSRLLYDELAVDVTRLILESMLLPLQVLSSVRAGNVPHSAS